MSWPIWSGRKIVTITSGAPTTRNSRKKSCCHCTKLRETGSLTGERHPLQSEARDQNLVGQGRPVVTERAWIESFPISLKKSSIHPLLGA